MEWIVQLGFELDIYQADELAGMYWYVVLQPPCRTSRSVYLLDPSGLRYLQHLANTRLQHVERIRIFTSRAFGRISKPSGEESSSFGRSFSFLGFAMLEASAIQAFADGLSCVSALSEPSHFVDSR